MKIKMWLTPNNIMKQLSFYQIQMTYLQILVEIVTYALPYRRYFIYFMLYLQILNNNIAYTHIPKK